MSRHHPSPAGLEGAPNFRDLGGIVCAGGRPLRPGRLLRSGQMSHLTAADLALLAGYRVGLVCDLRSAGERDEAKNLWPEPGAVQTLIPGAKAGHPEAARPSTWGELLRDPAFDGEAARQYLIAGYSLMPAAYAGLLAELFAHLERGEEAAVLIHCVAGKDRTGFVCAMLLAALGAPREAIAADYLASRAMVPGKKGVYLHSRRPLGPSFPAHAVDAIAVLAGVEACFLDASYAALEASHGSVEAYLSEAAGLAPALRERLRERLLD